MNNSIAVILPVYKNDKPEWLRSSIDSIINQTHDDYHLYIGVDGPVGEDVSFVLSCYAKLEEIDIIIFEKNRGLACVLNDLLDICFEQGYEYIARMDADDISLPYRFEKQLGFLHANPDIDVVGGSINEIDENGNDKGKIIVYPYDAEGCYNFFSRRNPHAHPAVMFRKSFFEKAGCKYRPEYRQNQDTMLWFDGMKAGTKHANIPDVVLNFRFTNSLFKKRRNGWSFAKKQLVDRKTINKDLGYGVQASIFAYCMFVMLISPPWVKKIAYTVFR